MSYMFNKYFSLISLKLSNFNINYGNDMSSMFHNCSSLTKKRRDYNINKLNG